MENIQLKNRSYYYTGTLLMAIALILLTAVLTAESLGHIQAYPYVLGLLAAGYVTGSFFLAYTYLKKGKHGLLEYICLSALRYAVSITMLGYALTKFRNGHMYLSYAALDSRLNDLSSFDMVWSFYGRYSLFQAIIGLLEFVPATLLLFRRTAFIGAILMFPVIANVVLLNSFYPAGGFTLMLSLLVLVFTGYIIYSYKNLIITFLKQVSMEKPVTLKPYARKIIFTAKVLPLAFFGLLLVMRVIAGRSHQPVKGGYELTGFRQNGTLIKADSLPADAYRKIYFEKRRIQSSVINKEGPQGASIALYDKDSIRITYRNGPLDMVVATDTTGMFSGTYQLRGTDGLILKGTQQGNMIEAQYKKIPLREFDYWWE